MFNWPEMLPYYQYRLSCEPTIRPVGSDDGLRRMQYSKNCRIARCLLLSSTVPLFRTRTTNCTCRGGRKRYKKPPKFGTVVCLGSSWVALAESVRSRKLRRPKIGNPSRPSSYALERAKLAFVCEISCVNTDPKIPRTEKKSTNKRDNVSKEDSAFR